MTPLSELGHDQLKMQSIRQMITCRACANCGAHSNGAPKGTIHPLQNDLHKVSAALDNDPSNERLSRERHRLISQIHHTSRCCGARLINAEFDYHEALWDSWKNRVRDFTALANGHKDELIANIRKSMRESEEVMGRGYNGIGADDDYIMMNVLWGMEDYRTNKLISIFRQEEVRQDEIRMRECMDITDVMAIGESYPPPIVRQTRNRVS